MTTDLAVVNITVFILYLSHTAFLKLSWRLIPQRELFRIQILFCFEPTKGHRGTAWQLLTWKETVTTALLKQDRFILRTLWWITHILRRKLHVSSSNSFHLKFLTWPYDPRICPLASGCRVCDSHHSLSSSSEKWPWEVCQTLSQWAGYKMVWFKWDVPRGQRKPFQWKQVAQWPETNAGYRQW